MRISDEPSYLTCDFDLNTRAFHLSFLDEDQTTSYPWGETTRLSPVWPIDLSEYNDGSEEEAPAITHVCFVGPASPVDVVSVLQTDLLAKLPENRAWLSLGFFNFVFMISNNKELHLLTNFCNDHNCRMEFWRVSGPSDRGQIMCEDIRFLGSVEDENPDIVSTKTDGTPGSASNVSAPIDASINQAFMELHSLGHTTHARSHSRMKVLSSDLSELQKYIPALKEVLVETEEHCEPDRQKRNLQALKYRDNILNINAGLSRLVSQVYSGTSPIYQSECHSWPHSFLGLGVAILALRNLTSFVFEELNDLEINALYRQNLESPFELRREDGSATSIISEFQPRDYKLAVSDTDDLTDDLRGLPENQIPNPITYYSGRDGFRFGTFTQSAPLLAVQGCNSSQWTLGTISHEMSHRFVSPKLLKLFGELQNVFEANKSLTIESFTQGPAQTKHDASLKLLLLGLAVLEGLRLGDKNYEAAVSKPSEFIRNAITAHARETEEILVHIFDFVHFYNSDQATYMTSIWRSWAVQPSISNNFERYIFRTTGALSTLNFQEQDWINLAESMLTTMVDKHSLNSSTLHGQDIKDYLTKNSKAFRERMQVMSPIISLFYTIFHFPSIGPRLAHDGRDATGASWLVLNDESGTKFPNFENPLKFARDTATEATPNGAKSAWLLTALAYRYVKEED